MPWSLAVDWNEIERGKTYQERQAVIADIRAFVAAMVVCALAVLAVHAMQAGPISPAGVAKSYTAGLLFDYQTLITGLLAIVAAFITVREMRRADERSDKRHKESMELAVRGDRLKVQRALHPQSLEIKRVLKGLIELAEYRDRVDREAHERYEAFGHWVHVEREDEILILGIFPLIESLNEILDRPQFKEGAQLFDGDLAYSLWRLAAATSEAHTQGFWLYHYYMRDVNERTAADRHEFKKAFDNGYYDLVTSFPGRCVEMAMPVLDGMNRMAELYEVRDEWHPTRD